MPAIYKQRRLLAYESAKSRPLKGQSGASIVLRINTDKGMSNENS